MRKKDTSLLLSRYLVEDNQEDYVILDKSLTASTSVVSTIFRKLVGSYIILDELEEEQLKTTINTVKNILKTEN